MNTVELIPIEDFKPTQTGLYLIKYVHLGYLFNGKRILGGTPGYISIKVVVYPDDTHHIDFNQRDDKIILVSEKPIYTNPHDSTYRFLQY